MVGEPMSMRDGITLRLGCGEVMIDWHPIATRPKQTWVMVWVKPKWEPARAFFAWSGDQIWLDYLKDERNHELDTFNYPKITHWACMPDGPKPDLPNQDCSS